MRIDKYLAQMGQGTRSEVKQLLKKGKVQVNGVVEKSPKTHVNVDQDQIECQGKLIRYVDKIYIMLNKPKGFVSATKDDINDTVIDLISEYNYLDIFPVGRLDKDTEGLLLITNDGQFTHDLMSPKKHISKTYEVTAQKNITSHDIDRFKSGIELTDGVTKPAVLKKCETSNKSLVTLFEGRYHQIKRMFHAIDNEVIELKRIAIGGLSLDEGLAPGEYRQLTLEEIELLTNKEKEV
ncbi:rRNA pseudouridine synthase [Staphylococcus sp. SQ8-PEA]|uniref:Pseudouridine synthase n=1 Tax=Staphylococcus marylandisciuri TaxID=2981529 RepID=A0ABT2QS87_9STAP|nr:pseudouridine synthase [Staphylococcus marylandisciuri]MCU5746856.1 rRNA pseudouridine synthase [Staphylococcus marylandisciuri]